MFFSQKKTSLPASVSFSHNPVRKMIPAQCTPSPLNCVFVGSPHYIDRFSGACLTKTKQKNTLRIPKKKKKWNSTAKR